jgi:hypothetical protein
MRRLARDTARRRGFGLEARAKKDPARCEPAGPRFGEGSGGLRQFAQMDVEAFAPHLHDDL